MEQSPTIGMSFLAIQHSQQARVAPPKDKRSLREIQEEEHALQTEADFLIWWTAQEERVQQEAEAEALALVESQNNRHTPSSAPPPPPRKSSRNPRHKSDKKDRGESGTKSLCRSLLYRFWSSFHDAEGSFHWRKLEQCWTTADRPAIDRHRKSR
jgi:hypothetical protein